MYRRQTLRCDVVLEFLYSFMLIWPNYKSIVAYKYAFRFFGYYLSANMYRASSPTAVVLFYID